LNKPKFYNPYSGVDQGIMVKPGKYTIFMSEAVGGTVEPKGEPVTFEVKRLDNTIMPAKDSAAKVQFQKDVTELSRKIQGAGRMIGEVDSKLKHIREAIEKIEVPNEVLYDSYYEISDRLKALRLALYGDDIKTRLDIDQPPSPASRMGWIEYEQGGSTSDPTQTHIMSYEIAEEEFEPILTNLETLVKEDLEALEQQLEDADAPYTPGRAIKMLD